LVEWHLGYSRFQTGSLTLGFLTTFECSLEKPWKLLFTVFACNFNSMVGWEGFLLWRNGTNVKK